MTLDVGDRAPSPTVLDHDGRQVALADLWSERALVLLFTRHLGCAFCREQLVAAERHFDKVTQLGAGLAAVTMGTVDENTQLRRRRSLRYPVFSDERQEAYAAFEVTRGTAAQVMGPAVWGRGLQAVASCGLGKPRGDLRQLQDTFLIGTDGLVAFAHHPRNSSAQVDFDMLLKEISTSSAS